MYSFKKLKIYNISQLLKVSGILYKCGKDMAAKYGLQHWNNSHFKNWVIVALCALKNDVYLVYNEKMPAATFQTRKLNDSFLFQKLATSPEFAGSGIGTLCLGEIERLAKQSGAKEIICEVYDKSKHAISFYEKKGFSVYGAVDTLKYTELKLKKEL